MGGVLEGFGLIAVLVAVGYLLGRSGVLGEGASHVLSRLAFFVATPALLFTTLAASDVRAVFSAQSVAGWIAASAMLAVYLLLALLVLRRPARESVIGALCAGYVNAGNLGIPIAVYALGGAADVAPAMMFQLVVLAPVAFVVLDTLGGRGDKSLLRAVLVPLANPVLVAAVAGVAVSAWQVPVPQAVLLPVEMVAGIAVPVMLFAFGISLRGSPLPGRSPEVRTPMLLAVGLKSVAQPFVAWLLAAFAFGLTGPALLAAVVVAALPTAQNVFTFAMRYGAGVTLSREAILVSTMLSVPVIIGASALLA